MEAGNRLVPHWARLFKETIISTIPSKPLPRTPKGTVQLKKAVGLYATEIDEMYESLQDTQRGGSIELPASWSVSDLQVWIRFVIKELLGRNIAVDDDFFDQGADR